MPKVIPRCRLGIRKPYVSVQGYYMPCCNIGNEPGLTDYRNFLGDLIDQVDLTKTTLSSAVSSEAIARLEASWEDGTFNQCVFQCGRPLDDG